MTDHNDGRWHGWNGGECPVHPASVVRVVFSAASREKFYDHPAGNLEWANGVAPSDIIAFRVIKPYCESPKPREWWLYGENIFDSLNEANLERQTDLEDNIGGGAIIHVREVLK